MGNNPARGPEEVEKTLGLLWSVVDDTVTAVPRYNIHGNARAKPLGPPLKEMSDEEIRKVTNSRMIFLRISAQTYDKMANILGPLMFSCKVLSSRACELASVDELEEDLMDRDPEFVTFCREFLVNLKRVQEIVPFSRCWVPRGFTLAGFVTSLDGGKSGYGAIIHAIAVKTKEETKKKSTSDDVIPNGNLEENEVDEKLLG